MKIKGRILVCMLLHPFDSLTEHLWIGRRHIMPFQPAFRERESRAAHLVKDSPLKPQQGRRMLPLTPLCSLLLIDPGSLLTSSLATHCELQLCHWALHSSPACCWVRTWDIHTHTHANKRSEEERETAASLWLLTWCLICQVFGKTRNSIFRFEQNKKKSP